MDKTIKFIETHLKGAYIIKLKPGEDERGLFVRIFCKEEFKKIKHSKEFVQINHSITTQKGTIRGLHYQVKPSIEIKVVRCIQGRVFDVIVDLRKESPTFLKWYGVELSREDMNMIYIPERFAHGFQTLSKNCELIYLHSDYYSPSNERGLKYNDPALNISWPLTPTIISERDNSYYFSDLNFKGVL